MIIAFLSFTVYDPETAGGELYAAVISLQDALEENEAISVFLGLTEETTEQDSIRLRAEAYIRAHEGSQ